MIIIAVASAAIAYLLPVPAAPASPPPARAPITTCIIVDNATLRACAAQASHKRVLVFAANVTTPPGGGACGPGGAPAIAIRNAADLTIDGNGHVWRRLAPLSCGAVAIAASHDVTVRNLTIVENPQTPPCELSRKRCPSTIDIDNASNVTLDGVRLYDGKGYVVRVWHTNGFTFTRSVIANAGEIGLYVGHWKYGASRNITIANSVFAHTRTNAVAIEGADNVAVRDNVFNDNHWHGLWPVPGVKGGITSGGQLLIADAAGAVVAGNLFANGACRNCVPRGQAVTTIELGGNASDPGVRGLTIAGNTVLNAASVAFHQNVGARVLNVQITGNYLRGRVVLDDIRDAARSRNIVVEPRAPRFGRTTSEAFRIRANGTVHTAATPEGLPRGTIEAAFALSPAPVPAGPAMPVLRCVRGGSDFPSPNPHCGGIGTPAALLGFAYSAATPGARPFFLCQATSPPSSRFLSWDRHCDGATMIALLGFARKGTQ